METRFSERTVTAQGRKLVGHAARFGVPARVVVNGRVVTERIAAGAFAKSLARSSTTGRDVLCLLDHDKTRLLGRTKSNTLRLREDDVGLAFEVDLPETQSARDTLALAERGDIGGASFAFFARRQSWNADKTECVVLEADLVEVSIVAAHPAYNTDVHARSEQNPEPLTARQRRLRLLEIGGAS